MKNILNILMLCIATPLFLSAQTMTWLPSNYTNIGGCENLTDCEENIVCYKLQYTPDSDGVLTSYTTGFFANCQNGETALVENASCLMSDNSRQIEACHVIGKILMNCSGNSGSGEACILQKDVPIILHQVCFQIANKQHVKITEDETTDLTLSINLPANQALAGKTEFPSFAPYLTKNDWICNNTTEELVLEIKKEKEKEKIAILNWSPTAESGMGFYQLERSIDGITFELIYTIRDQQFDINELIYQTFDEDAIYGFNFYRLKYSEVGKIEMTSNIVSIYFFDGRFGVGIYPNPASDLIHLAVNTAEESFEYTISNQLGMQLLQGKAINMPENTVDIKSLLPGAYTLSIVSGNQKTSQTFIKIK